MPVKLQDLAQIGEQPGEGSCHAQDICKELHSQGVFASSDHSQPVKPNPPYQAAHVLCDKDKG